MISSGGEKKTERKKDEKLEKLHNIQVKIIKIYDYKKNYTTPDSKEFNIDLHI